MNRQIGVKRLYSLGDYKNITFDDIMTEVPEQLAFDAELVSQIKFLQLISIEEAFRKYIRLMEKYPLTGEDHMIDALEKLRQDTIKSIQSILPNGHTEV